jgi:puromycin-sensitive aminopeptidase
VTLDVPPGLGAYSNGPETGRTALEGGGAQVQFGDTIPMSTYLVAFVVGPMVATDPVDVRGTAVRVVHVPGKEALTAFALEAAAHSLEFFTDWFGIDYPGEKLDLVAIPDFAFGAMENLGCVTFREAVLLADPARASRVELERIADVISHEIAHMWFGDLVTMRWWNGIWLNEAFATFMELLCVDHFRPEWQRWVTFGMEREAAMATDALHATRPVEYPVGPPEEAQGMFDVLTYQKGAGVLRMLERYLGAQRFQAGIRRYLDTHRYANTETADLWDALEASSGEPVRAVMDSWILQGGFPLVTVHSDVLSQEPFSYAPGGGPSAIGSRWSVPVITRALGGTEARILLGSDPTAIDGGALGVVNAGGSGYYRVRYAPDHLRALAGRLGELELLERFNLLGDTWAAVVAQRAGLDDFLLLAEAAADEIDPDVWAQVTGPLSFLDHAVDDATRPALAAYARALLAPVFARLGWDPEPGEGPRVPTLRAQLVAALGTVGQDPAVRAEATGRYEAAERGEAVLDPDLFSAVLSVVAAAGGEARYEDVLEHYRHPATPQEEMRYLYALAGFGDAALAARTFDLARTEVRSQNAPFVVHLLLANREAGPATWGRVAAHWDELGQRVPATMVPRLVDGVRLLCRDDALAEEIRDFVVAHPVRSGQRTVEQTLERLAVNVSLAASLRDSAGRALAAGTGRLGAR